MQSMSIFQQYLLLSERRLLWSLSEMHLTVTEGCFRIVCRCIQKGDEEFAGGMAFSNRARGKIKMILLQAYSLFYRLLAEIFEKLEKYSPILKVLLKSIADGQPNSSLITIINNFIAI